jgi:hypothetical protein
MKKTVLTLAALLFAWIFANAQFNFGIKGGYNSSLNMGSIPVINPANYALNDLKGELKNGFHLGAFARIGGKIYVQPELLYGLQKKSYQFTIQDIQNTSNVKKIENHITFSTVDIPVLIGYKIVDAKIFNLRAFAGPKFKLNAGSKLSFTNLANNTELEDNDPTLTAIKGELKNAAVGLEVGAGVDLLMFTLDARLNLINDVYTAKWQEKPDLNSNFVISLGWKF